jgi:hypothetical protein
MRAHAESRREEDGIRRQKGPKKFETSRRSRPVPSLPLKDADPVPLVPTVLRGNALLAALRPHFEQEKPDDAERRGWHYHAELVTRDGQVPREVSEVSITAWCPGFKPGKGFYIAMDELMIILCCFFGGPASACSGQAMR